MWWLQPDCNGCRTHILWYVDTYKNFLVKIKAQASWLLQMSNISKFYSQNFATIRREHNSCMFKMIVLLLLLWNKMDLKIKETNILSNLILFSYQYPEDLGCHADLTDFEAKDDWEYTVHLNCHKICFWRLAHILRAILMDVKSKFYS